MANLKIINYVRRCRSLHNDDVFFRVHAADNIKTFCGKELNEMWFVESSAGMTRDDVTCKKCLKAMGERYGHEKSI